MIDRYAREALARYGRVRQLDPAAARAELEHFDQLLVIEWPRPVGHTTPDVIEGDRGDNSGRSAVERGVRHAGRNDRTRAARPPLGTR